MKRWCRAAAVAVLLLVTGCDQSSEPDDVPAFGSVGDCYGERGNKPVDCASSHLAETVYVGKGHAPRGSAGLAPCREAQVAYLGQDFNTRLDVQLWIAGDDTWYRCDVFLRNSTRSDAGFQSLTGSLKAVLETGVAADLQSCLGEPFDSETDQKYVPCSEPHIAQELVTAPAIGTLTEPFPNDLGERATRACNAAAAAVELVGKSRVVRAYYPKNADAWATGERTADCWVTARKGTLPPVEPTG